MKQIRILIVLFGIMLFSMDVVGQTGQPRLSFEVNLVGVNSRLLNGTNRRHTFRIKTGMDNEEVQYVNFTNSEAGAAYGYGQLSFEHIFSPNTLPAEGGRTYMLPEPIQLFNYSCFDNCVVDLDAGFYFNVFLEGYFQSQIIGNLYGNPAGISTESKTFHVHMSDTDYNNNPARRVYTMTAGLNLAGYEYEVYIEVKVHAFFAASPTYLTKNSVGEPQLLFCDGDLMQLEIDQHPGFTGGVYQWYKSTNGGSFQLLANTKVINVQARHNETYLARILRICTEGGHSNGFGCRFDAQGIGHDTGDRAMYAPSTLFIGPPPYDLDNATFTPRDACGPTESGELRVQLANLSPSLNYRVNIRREGTLFTQTFNAENGSSSADHTFTSLAEGTYEIQVTLINTDGTDINCTSPLSHATIGQRPLPVINSVDTQSSLCQPDRGDITVNVLNNTGPVTVNIFRDTPGYLFYQLNNITGSAVFSNLLFGSWRAEIIDAFGCQSQSFQFEHQAGDPIGVTLSPVVVGTFSGTPYHVQCRGGTGSFTVNVNSSGTFNVYVNGQLRGTVTGNTTSTISNVSAGANTVVITPSSCPSLNPPLHSTVITLTQPANPIVISPLSITNISACGGSSQVIVSTQVGNRGVGALQFGVFSSSGDVVVPYGPGSNGSRTFTDLAVGNYQARVRDGLECTVTRNFSISQDPPLALEIESIQPASCPSVDDGSFIAVATGGSGSIQYSLDPNGPFGTNNNFTDYFAQTYTVYAKDGRDCQISNTFLLPSLDELSITSARVTAPDCNSMDRFVRIQLSGRNGREIELRKNSNEDYEDAVVNEDNESIELYDLNPGNYEFTVRPKDSQFCYSGTVPLEVVPPEDFAITFFGAFSEDCPGQNNGFIDVNITGDTGPFNYTLYKMEDGTPVENEATGFISNKSFRFFVSAGEYYVVITNWDNCVIQSSNVVLEERPGIVATFESIGNNINCYGDNGTLQVSNVSGGADGEYLFSYNGGDFTNSTVYSNAGDQNTIVVMDINGCEETFLFEIPMIDILIDTEVEVTVPITTNCLTAPGIFTLDIIDGYGPFQVSIGPPDQDCNYSMDEYETGPHEFTVGLAGEYKICVRDAEGCESEHIINMPAIAELSSTVEVTPNLCASDNDGVIELTIGGGTAPFSVSFEDNDAEEIVGNVFQKSELRTDNFNVLVIDSRGCEHFRTVQVGSTSYILANIEVVEVSPCSYSENASVSVEPYGGVGNHSIEWYMVGDPSFYYADSGPTGTVFVQDNLPVSTVYVQLRDEENCLSIITIPIEGPVPVTANFEFTHPICNTVPNGTVTVTGSTSEEDDLTFSLNEESNSSGIFEGLPAGNYELVASNVAGCEASYEVILEDERTLIMNTFLTDPKCHGDETGFIQVAVTGGAVPYTYELNNGPEVFAGASPFVINALTAGIYEAKVLDKDGCYLNTGEMVLEDPALLEVIVEVIEDANCDEPTGTLSATATGGQGTYQFMWNSNPQNTTNVLTNAPSGTHVVTVMDEEDCIATASGTISDFPVLSLNLAGISPEYCYRGDGSITVEAVGGTAPFSYFLESVTYSVDNGTLNQFSNLVSGEYTIAVVDHNGCSSEILVSVPFVQASQVQILEVKPSYCTDDNGSIELEVSGAAPYEFSWSHDSHLNANMATGLMEGIYSVTVTDNNGCTIEDSFSIDFYNGPIIEVVTTPAACMGNTGSMTASLVPGNGTGPFQYQWSHNPNLNASIANNIGAGTYQVTVTDTNSCTDVVSAEVEGLPPPSAGINIFHSACELQNGSVQLSLEGGTAPYQVSWSNGASGNNLLNVGAGEYGFTVTDFYGCTTQEYVSLIDVPGPEYINAIVENSNCRNFYGSITCVPVGGTTPYQYTWSHNALIGGPTAQNLAGGQYSVTLTDARGCTLDTTLNVQYNPPPNIENSIVTNSFCVEGTGSIDLQPEGNGPFEYTWNNGLSSSFIDSLSSGTYRVTVTDVNGCSRLVSFSVGFEGGQSLSLQSLVDDVCGQAIGSARVRSTGGTSPISYSWRHDPFLDDPMANSLLSGEYTAFSTDANGCMDSLDVFVGEVSGPVISSTQISPAYCGNEVGSITVLDVIGNGPFSYLWSHDNQNSDPTATGLPPGEYQVTVTDGNQCQDSITESIEGTPSPTISNISLNDDPCLSEDVQAIASAVDGSGNNVFTWSHNPTLTGNTASGLTSGMFQVTVTDIYGCSDNSMFQVVDQSGPSLEVINIENSTCGTADGSITLSASGGQSPYNFLWSHDADLNGNTANQLSSGEYTVTLVDANNCEQVLVASVSDSSGPEIEISEIGPSICENGNGQITVMVDNEGGDINYSWSHDSTLTGSSADGLSAGNYSVTATDQDGCISILSYQIEYIAPASYTAEIMQETCQFEDGSISIQLEGDNTSALISWDHLNMNGYFEDQLSAGTYTGYIIDSNNCYIPLALEVPNSPGPSLVPVTWIDATCGLDNGQLEVGHLGGHGSVEYIWNDFPDQQGASAIGLATGIYTVIGLDELGCSDTLYWEVQEVAPLTFNVETTDTACGEENGQIHVTPSSFVQVVYYNWSHDPTIVTSSAYDLSPGTYSLFVLDENDCSYLIEEQIYATGGLEVVLETENVTGCNLEDGIASIMVIGGSGNYTFEWLHDNELNSAQVTDLAAGYYEVKVTDDAGCEITASFIIEQPENDELILDVNHADCGQNNGSISVNMIPDASYSWTFLDDLDVDLPGSFEVQNLQSGTYLLEIELPNGCEISEMINVEDNEFDLPEILPVAGCEGLSNGLIEAIDPEGWAGQLDYNWSTGATGNIIDNLQAGIYTLTISDNEGCTQIVDIELDELTSPMMTVAQIDPPSCDGSQNGAIELSGEEPGWQFQWSDPNIGNVPFASNISSGLYTVTVTDENGCSDILSIPVEDDIDFSVSVISYQSPLCVGDENGSIELGVFGTSQSISFQWSDPTIGNSPIGEMLASGIYMITATNEESQCIQVIEVDLPARDSLLLNSVVENENCYAQDDGSIQLNISGGTAPYDISWPHDAGLQNDFLSNLSPATYQVIVEDANGCFVEATFEILPASIFEVELVDIIDLVCPGENQGAASALITGGEPPLDFVWNDPFLQQTSSISGLFEGNYSLLVTDNNGCITTAEFTVVATPQIVIESSQKVDPLCHQGNDGTISILASGGYGDLNYLWNSGEIIPELNQLSQGQYSVTISDENSCFEVINFNLQSPPQLFISSVDIEPTVCQEDSNGSINVLNTGGVPPYRYYWNDDIDASASIVSNLQAGMHSLLIIDDNDCTLESNFTLQHTSPSIIVSGIVQNPECDDAPDGSIILSLSGGMGNLTPLWDSNGSELELTSLIPGSYSVTVTDENLCTASNVFLIEEGDPFILDVPNEQLDRCAGSSLFIDFNDQDIGLSIEGPEGYLNTELLQNLSVTGTYYLYAINELGCEFRDSIELVILDEPLVAFFVVATDVVVGQEIAAIEVSWPIPESVDWIYPADSVEFIRQNEDEYIFKFLYPGNIRLGMKAMVGDCEDYLYKYVTVHSDSTTIPGLNPEVPDFLDVMIAPNPNQGNFSVNIEVNRVADIAASLYSSTGSLINRRLLRNASSYSEQYQQGLQPGNYILIVQSSYQKRTFVINVIP